MRTVLTLLKSVIRRLDQLLYNEAQDQAAIAARFDAIDKKLAQIDAAIEEPEEQAAGFVISFSSGEKSMPKAADATLDFQLLDDGTALATLQTVDAKQNPIPFPAGASTPSWTSSDPDVTVTPATDGLSAVVSDGGALATGVLITAISTLADGTSISGTGTIDVVADPNKPGAFVMSIAAQ